MMKLPEVIQLGKHPWIRAQLLRQLFDPKVAANLRECVSLPGPYAPEYGTWTQDNLEQHSLFSSLMLHGYNESKLRHQKVDVACNGEGIQVDIDSGGNIGVRNGLHRFCYSLALGITDLPAKVVYRDPEWTAKLQRLYDACGQHYTYQAIPHPDLDGWAVGQKELRLKAVADLFESKGVKNLVDIGGGYGSFGCGTAPFLDWVQIVELSDLGVEWSRWRSCHQGTRNVQVLQKNAYDFMPMGSTDCIALLSVMHHLIHERGEAAMTGLLRLWRSEGRLLLTENPAPGEPILNVRPEATSWMQHEVERMLNAGWRLLSELGRDGGFCEPRVIRVWEAL